MGQTPTKSSRSQPSGSEELSSAIQSLDLNAGEQGFFDRKVELSRLVGILAGSPVRITVITGPKNCGKSKLLSYLRDVWEQPEANPWVQVLAPLIIVNMSARDCSTPEKLAEVLRAELQGWQELAKARLKALAAGSSKAGEDVIKAMAEFREQGIKGRSGLGAVQDLLGRYMDRHQQVRPVFIFDHADMFSAWQGKYDQELDALFRFFEGITKQRERAHVMFVSSDSCFDSWLTARLSRANLLPLGLGFFSEDQAKLFFEDYCCDELWGLTLPDDWETGIWPRVYEVAGGCPLLLRGLADSAAGNVNILALAADAVHVQEVVAVRKLVERNECSDEDIKLVMKLIVDNGGYVQKEELINEFGGSKKASTVVDSLLKANLIHQRVVTALSCYTDLPKDMKYGEYILPFSPCNFGAMKEIVREDCRKFWIS